MTALLDVQDLEVTVPAGGSTLHAVRSVTFALERGETLCLVGESGCGKTLTALAVMGLLPRLARRRLARLAFDGDDMRDWDEGRLARWRGNRAAFVFQEPMTSLNPTLTIGRQMTECLQRHRGASYRAAADRAVHLLERVGIRGAAERLEHYPHELSGGLRQRVMIAMALMCSPELLIADEPTTALDVTVQAQILRLLQELKREFGMALLFITHDLAVVSRIADRVGVMYAGELVEVARTVDLFRAPRHPYTRALIACVPRPGEVSSQGRLSAIPGSVPALTGVLDECAFRNRCPLAVAECARGAIRMHDVGERHFVRCVRSAPAPLLAP